MIPCVLAIRVLAYMYKYNVSTIVKKEISDKK